MGELSKLPNIGKIVEEQLINVGINSIEELKKIGVKKTMLDYEIKADLKEFFISIWDILEIIMNYILGTI